VAAATRTRLTSRQTPKCGSFSSNQLDSAGAEEDAERVPRRIAAISLSALLLGAAAGSAAVVTETTACSIDLRARNANTGCELTIPGGEVKLDGSLATTIRAPGGARTAFEYDARGRLTSATTDGAATAYEYDAAGRLVRRVDPSGAVTPYEYDAFGRLVSAGDTRLIYAQNRLAAAVLADDRIVRYTYDPRGNLVGTADSANVTSYTYDDHRRLTSASSAASALVYSYDEEGRIIRRVLNDGTATSYSYDKRALVASVGPDGQVVEYSYDADGSMLSAGTRSSGTRLSYDQTGRFVAIAGLDNELTVVDYDAEGRPRSVLPEPGDEVVIQFAGTEFDGDYRVDEVTWSDDYGTGYTLTPRGRLLHCSVCP
jgi:YD repeat-containing protein